MRIAVAMSGGVDSSAAALVLRDEGHEVIGITAWLWECASPASERACCGSAEALKKAKEAATSLGLRHEVVDLSAEFEREVVGPTVSAYASGRTPNPCVLCNARVRFPFLATAAREAGAEALATGHYARLVKAKERVSLMRGRDREHDQSYFLFAVAPADLEFARFPLGNWEKPQTRKLAADAAHPSAERLSSQDLCFTGGRAPGELVRSRMPDAVRPGPIVDTEGRMLGRHGGLVDYTVGQRKGIGVPWSEPLFVVDVRPETNELVVGTDRGPAGAPDGGLRRRRFEIEELSWQRAPGPEAEGQAPSGGRPTFAKATADLRSFSEGCRPALAGVDEFESLVQIRYRTPAVPCRVRPLEGGRAEVTLDEPARAVAPGQCAVFYDTVEGEKVLGGGWIARARKEGGRTKPEG